MAFSVRDLMIQVLPPAEELVDNGCKDLCSCCTNCSAVYTPDTKGGKVTNKHAADFAAMKEQLKIALAQRQQQERIAQEVGIY
jgi:hypothetical protein